jgi:hypothetical protein
MFENMLLTKSTFGAEILQNDLAILARAMNQERIK